MVDIIKALWTHKKRRCYVKSIYKQKPSKFSDGTIRKFGNPWLVTTEEIEAIAGIKD